MRYDVGVVGAGVIGLCIARELARDGASVVVIDRGEPFRHASWAAAGMLSPQAEANAAGPLLDFLLRAREVYPAHAAELREETDLDIGYRAHGTLLLALDDADEARLEERLRWQREAGLAVERLSAEQVHREEKGLAPNLRWALHFAGDHQVDNRLLGTALRAAANAAGATVRLGAGVRRLRPKDGCALVLEDGGRIEVGTAVLAAGCWSGTIDGLPRPLPVEPVHGELVSLRADPPIHRHTIGSAHAYLVPRADGRLILGTTVERIGFRTRVTAGGLHRILEGGFAMSPELAERPVIDHWAGLRPGTPDNLPILGRDPEAKNLIYATGHFRNGILLAPLTGRVVADLVMGRETPDLAPFRPDRFER